MLDAPPRTPAPFHCPQCGADVSPDEEDSFVTCAFCGSSLHLEPGGAFRHEIVPAVLARDTLAGRLGRWLEDMEAIGSPKAVSARLLYFPLWVLPQATGRPVEPAAPLLAEPLDGFPLPSGDLKAFREDRAGDAEVIPASIRLESLRRDPVGTAPPAARLVHVPYWDVAYRVGSQAHRAWIDAVSGRVLPLSDPVSAEARLDRVYAGLLAGTFVIVMLGALLLFAGGARTALGLATLGGAGPAALWTIRRVISRVERG